MIFRIRYSNIKNKLFVILCMHHNRKALRKNLHTESELNPTSKSSKVKQLKTNNGSTIPEFRTIDQLQLLKLYSSSHELSIYPVMEALDLTFRGRLVLRFSME